MILSRDARPLGRRPLHLRLPRGVQRLQLRRADTRHATLLIGTEPRLLGVAEHAPGEEVRHQADDDEHKGNGVHPVDDVPEDADPDDDAPKVGRQERDVEEGSRAHTQDQGGQRVEDCQGEGEADEMPDGVVGELGLLDGGAVKDGRLDAEDAEAEEAQERKHLVHGPLADEELLKHVGDAVESGAEKTKEVALQHVGARPAVGAGDVVRRQQDAHPSAADEDAGHLEYLVAHAEQREGDYDNAHDGPKVEELRRQEVGVAVRKDRKVVALHVEEGQDQVLPALPAHHSRPLLGTILPERDGGVDDDDEGVCEEQLERRDVGSGIGDEGCEGVGARDAEGKDLPDGEDNPEIHRRQVRVPLYLAGLDML